MATLKTTFEPVFEKFAFQPRYNVAPTQQIPVVRDTAEGRELAGMKWGLVPAWADDPSIGNRMINARAETVGAKPVFRSLLKGGKGGGRCILPADGFYEWSHDGKVKTPHLFHLIDDGVFAFAGLWSTWRGGAEREGGLTSCTLITTTPNELVAPVHNRMPVMLDRPRWEAWLDPDTKEEDLLALLQPFPASKMSERAVSRAINSPKNDHADLLNSA